MMLGKVSFVTTALCLLVLVKSAKIKLPTVVDWEPCISEDTKVNEKQVGEIKQIRVFANCTGRCQLKLNSTIQIEVDFDPGEDTDTLEPEMSALIGPIEIPFPVMRTNACDSIFTSKGDTCPLKKGTLYTYRRVMPIKDEYPPIFLSIKLKYLTDKKHTSICFILKSQLVE